MKREEELYSKYRELDRQNWAEKLDFMSLMMDRYFGDLKYGDPGFTEATAQWKVSPEYLAFRRWGKTPSMIQVELELEEQRPWWRSRRRYMGYLAKKYPPRPPAGENLGVVNDK